MTAVAVGLAAVIAFFLGWLSARQVALRAATSRLRQARRTAADLETTLARLSAQWGAAMDVAADAVLVLDSEHRVIESNAVAQATFDFDQKSRPSLMVATRSAELLEMVREASDLPGSSEGYVRSRDRRLHVRARRLDTEGVLVILRDETRLERLERARRDLVANISHDLRTPLTSMNMLADALGDPAIAPGDIRRLARQMSAQVGVLQTITDGLLELERVESGRALLQLRPEHAATLAQEALTSLLPQLRDKGVAVEVAVPGQLLVLADAGQVARVFANLLDNALRHSPPGGSVTISAVEGPDDTVLFRVADSGPGIPPSELERVFERFYRGDRSRTSKGSGLGLAIVRHIVEAHGGRISASSPPGQGAVIEFSLPAADSIKGSAAGR